MKYISKGKTPIGYLLDIVISAAIAIALSLILAVFLALIPGTDFNEYSNPIIKIDKEKNIESTKKSESSRYIYEGIERLYPSDVLNLDRLVAEGLFETNIKESHREYIYKAILSEIHLYTFLLLWFLVSLCKIFSVFSDYFPHSSSTSESGIHAKLNYQRIADKKTRKLSLLMIFIIIFSILFIFTIFRFASEIDSIIHQEDIDAYDTWIQNVKQHIDDDTKFVEENTKIFWIVFFTRFLLVRMLIAVLVTVLITFLIRLYNQTRRDRDLIIQKEEALSALQYISRGEWQYQYDDNGNALLKKISDCSIVSETEVDIKHLDQYKRLYVSEMDDSLRVIPTKEFLSLIPIHELFRLSDYGSKKAQIPPIENVENGKKYVELLSEIKEVKSTLDTFLQLSKP